MQKCILIVEDEPAIREMVAFALRKAGMDPVHAADARAAQGMIAERVPDLILLDWMLPGTSGLELARRLRADPTTAHMLLVACTAFSSTNDMAHAKSVGFDAHCAKPLTPQRLLRVLEAATTHRAQDPC